MVVVLLIILNSGRPPAEQVAEGQPPPAKQPTTNPPNPLPKPAPDQPQDPVTNPPKTPPDKQDGQKEPPPQDPQKVNPDSKEVPGGKGDDPPPPDKEPPPQVVREPEKDPELPKVEPVQVVLPPEKDRPWLVLDPSGHSAAVPRVLFTPSANRVISVSGDKTIRLWDAATGEPLATWRLPVGPGDEGALWAAALTPDGRTLAVGGVPYGGGAHGVPIYLISMATGQIERTIRGHKDLIRTLAFSRGSGKYLASGSGDNLGAVFDATTGKPMCVFKGHRGTVREIVWDPRGRLLATAASDGTARIWEFPTGKSLAVLPPPTKESKILSLAWSPDGNTIATGTLLGDVQLWGRDGQLRKTYALPTDKGHRINVFSLAFTPDGRELLYTGVDHTGRAGLLDVATGQVRLAFPGHNNTSPHGTLSRDGKLVVSSGGDDNEILIWKTDDGTIVQKMHGQGRSIFAVGWSADGRTLCWGNTNRNFGGKEAIRAGAAARLEHGFRLDRLELGGLPPGEHVRVLATANGYSLEGLDFFRIAIKRQGQTVHTFRAPGGNERLYSYTLVPGDRAVIGGSSALYLIELPTGRILRHLRGHSGNVMSVSLSPDGRLVLTGGTDQRICLWDLNDDLPVLTLFVADRDWIAWTPQGYYACSAQGERLMGWQVNNGPDKLAHYYPAVQFRQSLYRPEVIKLLRRTNLGTALAIVGRDQKGGPVAAVNVTQVLPPEVVLASPEPGPLPAGQAKVTVRATAQPRGGHPVVAMRLILDGRPFEGGRGVRTFNDGQVAERQATWEVALSPGRHVLAVQAESPVSKGSSGVEVTLAGTKQADPPNLYVLAVGISAYPGKMRLNYAHADAIVIEKVFKERTKGVFAKVETKLLTDKLATRQNILDGLAWLGGRMTAKDVGIIFFAGHGTQDPEGGFHLIPVDVNLKDPEGTCVSGELLKKTLGDMPGRLVAMLDACHSGASALGTAPPKRPGKVVTDDLVRDLITDDYGVVVMCSSQGHEYSLESGATKHGFFTLGLVEGLTGKADFNRDRVLHIHEVDAYALLRVRQLSGGRQNPVTGRPPTIRSFPLAGY
ncbi:MAG TPA: caspase family protein [Gemmataceae bacterium]|nr:caspase family protein [Gemmataceae bacterium]